MIEVPHTNITDHVQHVGGKMVRPGETRMVDPSLVAGGSQPAVMMADPPAAQTSTLPDLLACNVSEIKAALPAVDAAGLDELETLEEAGQARKGVLEAIVSARLTLAEDGGTD